MSKLLELLKKIPRSVLFRIEMRLRHALDNWEPQQRLFSQATILDQRSFLIEHRVADLAVRVEELYGAINKSLDALVSSFDDGDEKSALEARFALLEMRLVRIEKLIQSTRADAASSIETSAEVLANLISFESAVSTAFDAAKSEAQKAADGSALVISQLSAINVGVSERFDNVGVRLDDLTGLVRAGHETSADEGRLLRDLAADITNALEVSKSETQKAADGSALVISQLSAINVGVSERFDNVGVRLDDLTGLVRAGHETSARQDRVLEDRIRSIDSSAQATAAHAGDIDARVGRRVIALDDNLAAVTTPHGWAVVPREEFRTLLHLSDGVSYHEPGTVYALESLLRPGEFAIDVGAHIGLLALPMARRVGASGRVVCLEPFPRTAAALRRTIAANGFSASVEIAEVAASDSRGEAPLFLSYPSMSNSLYADGSGGRSFTVSTETLDSLVSPKARVDLVKIDAEGAELAVLRGMSRIVSENDAIIIIAELGPSHLVRTAVSVTQWLHEFREMGFEGLFELSDQQPYVRPLRSVEDLEATYSLNLLMVKEPKDPRILGLMDTSN